MSDDTRASFSFLHRHDLPGDHGCLHERSGTAKEAFRTAHDAQIANKADTPYLGNKGDPGGETWASKTYKERLAYSDPHPPYALPAKQAPDENHLKRQDFRATRLRNLEIRARRRSRGM